MNKDELQPCPFCGGTKICTEKSINLNYCDNCSAESNVEHWNTRPIEDALQTRIAELEAQQRWIPVEERLPENKFEHVLVCTTYGVSVRLALEIGEAVTHWMPLPEPPIVYGKVCEE